MKVIDILNKIANGEEVPEKILYSDKIWYWDTRENDYVEDYKRLFRYYLDECLISSLNDEVEVIEDKSFNERVEEIYNRHIDYIYNKEDKKIEKLVFNKDQDGDILVNGVSLIEKVNEIIDYINKGE